jgi:hypothetical protein
MHLSRLDNEVFFKKAFTDKLVFTQFVKDVIGIDIKFSVSITIIALIAFYTII